MNVDYLKAVELVDTFYILIIDYLYRITKMSNEFKQKNQKSGTLLHTVELFEFIDVRFIPLVPAMFFNHLLSPSLWFSFFHVEDVVGLFFKKSV